MVSVFVYGTLKPGQSNYAAYCGDWVLSALPAQVQGQLFGLSLGYPALAIGKGWVRGVLLQFADEAILTALDFLEDYQPAYPDDQNEYLRQWVEVFDRQGCPLGFAWAYFMTLQKVEYYGGTWIETGEWQGPS